MKGRKLAFLFQNQILVVTIAVLTVSCNLVSPIGREAPSEEGTSSPDFDETELNETELTTQRSQDCTNFKRPLNPVAEPTSPESNQDRYFRLAYFYVIEGEFDAAILNYHQASKSSNCDCDRLHAAAGEKAAREAREVLKKGGMAARPTQFFWGRLQELTQSLPCVEIR